MADVTSILCGPVSNEDMEEGSAARSPLVTARPQRAVTHLPLDAAGHGATAARADGDAPDFREHVMTGLRLPRQVLRGEGPPHGTACGG